MKLILFRGRPATGKTLMSDLLSTQINVPVLRKDDMYDAISVLTESHELRNQVSFKLIYAILESNSNSAASLILDCPFQFEDDILALRKWCDVHQVDLRSILVTCSDEQLWASRFNKRAENPTPNQLITNFEQLRQRYGAMQLEPGLDELVIDAVDAPEHNLVRILAFLGS